MKGFTASAIVRQRYQSIPQEAAGATCQACNKPFVYVPVIGKRNTCDACCKQVVKALNRFSRRAR